jgi:hypothetical protein
MLGPSLRFGVLFRIKNELLSPADTPQGHVAAIQARPAFLARILQTTRFGWPTKAAL